MSVISSVDGNSQTSKSGFTCGLSMSVFAESKHQILFEKPRKKKRGKLDTFPFKVPSSHDPPCGLTGRIFPVGPPCRNRNRSYLKAWFCLKLLTTSHFCPHSCVVHSVLFRTDNASTDVSRFSRTIFASPYPISSFYQFPNETSSLHGASLRTPIVWISSVHSGFDRKSHHYCCEQLYNFEAIARWTGYQLTLPALSFPSHQRSSRGRSTFAHLMGLMWPSMIFLMPSIIRCAPTSPPMNSFRFTRPIKRGLKRDTFIVIIILKQVNYLSTNYKTHGLVRITWPILVSGSEIDEAYIDASGLRGTHRKIPWLPLPWLQPFAVPRGP